MNVINENEIILSEESTKSLADTIMGKDQHYNENRSSFLSDIFNTCSFNDENGSLVVEIPELMLNIPDYSVVINETISADIKQEVKISARVTYDYSYSDDLMEQYSICSLVENKAVSVKENEQLEKNEMLLNLAA